MADNDPVGLLEGISSTRAIRRYRPESIPDGVLRDILFAATRAPSGSNRQPFRFMVFADSPRSLEVKALVAKGAQVIWGGKRTNEGYDEATGRIPDSPKARMARTMQHYVDHFTDVPVLVLAINLRYRDKVLIEGASIYPACQNLLLAARALGYGGALTAFHTPVEAELAALLGLPSHAQIAATITLGKPAGAHGPVRRAPMSELVFGDTWGTAPAWAVDPAGTRFASKMAL